MEVDDFEAKTNHFLSWLAFQGVVLSPKMALVDLRSSGRGRGVVATGDFESDELIFSVPRSAVLNLNTVFFGSSSVSDLEFKIRNLASWLALTAIILDESRRQDSKWAPYLAILPRQLHNLTFWSDAELSELQASKVVSKIGKSGAEEFFSRSLAPLGLTDYNIEECHKVASIIMSYAFDIPEENTTVDEKSGDEGEELVSDDEEDEKILLSMIPLADMLNADADRNNARLCCGNKDFEMRSIKNIAAGEEIFNDYGQLPRSDLLRRYGYVSETYALYDVAEIITQEMLSLFMSKEAFQGLNLSPLSQGQLDSRVELAEREGIFDDSYDLSHPGPERPSIPDELLALLYLVLLDDQSLKALYDSDGLPSRSKLATEVVGQVLVTVIQLREKEYATSLEEDETLLSTGNLPHRIAMAVQVRLGEKAVLRAAIKEATTFTGSNKRMRLGGKNNLVGEGKGKRSIEEPTGPKKKGRFR
ncbi:SET domain-containing protein [Hyaloscypha bicolor E]|uniref:SET domain-containing protein n=1 Tax=Hyaloscypha bicolor E TaxID=1095630 RepID=A0A2J6TQ38_9HELO|nr:SET domain-containing protein [Hyaloscypha bicolor E]PMD65141.1 SET domain-containing protein [Hyaloscypha bicolor E]